ncbi:MAG: hypothetical protein ACK5BN_08760, partial [Planctomycetota bacterium]
MQAAGASYRVVRLDIGKQRHDESQLELEVQAPNKKAFDRLRADLMSLGLSETGCIATGNAGTACASCTVAAVIGNVCRGRTCCGARLASTCWSARSARARGACWRRSTIRRRSRGCSGRSGGPRRG